MASLTSTFSLKSMIPGGGEGHDNNPLTMSDDQILVQIILTHVHSDTKFDVGPLFSHVHNTLTRSTHIVDGVVQGNSFVSLEHVDEKYTQANFSSPLCTLRQISFEMQCKPPGEQVAHKTTMAILGKLSHYEWGVKAVLTLAAFAMDCGDFWLLAQLQPNDLLAKSVAMLKRVPVLTKPASLQKHRQAIVELNSLTKSTLQVIEHILELEQLSSYGTMDVPALVAATEQIPLDVYWAIISIVAIVTRIDCLITESEHIQELSHYGQKINITLSKLRKQITLCRQQIEVTRIYYKIVMIMQNPTEISEVLKLLIFSSDVPKSLYDGASKTTVSIDVLEKKNVYLFVSTPDITDEERSVLLKIHEAIETKNQTDQYKIVWVPIEEEWTDQLSKSFENLKAEMPFFVVEHFGSVAGFKYMKEEWQFEKKAMVVTMNPQGKILHHNAFHLIHSWGIKAFPFTKTKEDEIHSSRQCIAPIVSQIHPQIVAWFEEEKYIFFYGGHDEDWVQEFNKYARSLANDAFLKEKKILIELFHVEKENKNIFSRRFWSGVESLFVTKAHKSAEEEDDVTKEIQKMLSYKNESGWALLSKGSEVILTGHGTTILKTVADFEKWKEFVVTKGFEWSFKECHENAPKPPHRCSIVEVSNVAGKLPERLRCSECPKTMEVYTTYKCCHNEATPNAAR